MGTLRDDLMPTVDSLRGLFSTFGVARYTVVVRRRTWSGGRPGLGTHADADTPIVTSTSGSPLVEDVSPREIAASGGTYVEGDLRLTEITPAYVALGTVTATGSRTGTVAPSVAIPTSGVDIGAFALVLQVLARGAPGTATFQYSTDGGVHFTGPVTTPGSGPFTVPGLGIAIAFTGTFEVADAFVFGATCGGFTPAQLRLLVTAPGDEVFYVLVGDEGELRCTFVAGRFDDAIGYRVVVRRRRETP